MIQTGQFNGAFRYIKYVIRDIARMMTILAEKKNVKS